MHRQKWPDSPGRLVSDVHRSQLIEFHGREVFLFEEFISWKRLGYASSEPETKTNHGSSGIVEAIQVEISFVVLSGYFIHGFWKTIIVKSLIIIMTKEMYFNNIKLCNFTWTAFNAVFRKEIVVSLKSLDLTNYKLLHLSVLKCTYIKSSAVFYFICLFLGSKTLKFLIHRPVSSLYHKTKKKNRTTKSSDLLC